MNIRIAFHGKGALRGHPFLLMKIDLLNFYASLPVIEYQKQDK